MWAYSARAFQYKHCKHCKKCYNGRKTEHERVYCKTRNIPPYFMSTSCFTKRHSTLYCLPLKSFCSGSTFPSKVIWRYCLLDGNALYIWIFLAFCFLGGSMFLQNLFNFIPESCFWPLICFWQRAGYKSLCAKTGFANGSLCNSAMCLHNILSTVFPSEQNPSVTWSIAQITQTARARLIRWFWVRCGKSDFATNCVVRRPHGAHKAMPHSDDDYHRRSTPASLLPAKKKR